jgi:hypothetical protein
MQALTDGDDLRALGRIGSRHELTLECCLGSHHSC